jgi:hypothetical protein
MIYKIQKTTEVITEQELNIPQFWASDTDVFFHKLLPNGDVLEIRPHSTRSTIRMVSIELAIHCGIKEITEEQFNQQFQKTKEYLGC